MFKVDMSADVRRKAKKLRTFYDGHTADTADMLLRTCPQICPQCPLVSAGMSAGVRRSKMSAVSADFLKKLRTSAAMSAGAGAPINTKKIAHLCTLVSIFYSYHGPIFSLLEPLNP